MFQLSHLYMTTGKTIASTMWTFVRKVMSLLFNTLSRFVIFSSKGFSHGSAGKESPVMWEAWLGLILWRRDRLPTPVFWPREFHGLYSPRGLKESDMTEQLSLSLSSKEQMFFFNFMAAVTIHRDFGAQENRLSLFHCFSMCLPWSNGTRCHTVS